MSERNQAQASMPFSVLSEKARIELKQIDFNTPSQIKNKNS